MSYSYRILDVSLKSLTFKAQNHLWEAIETFGEVPSISVQVSLGNLKVDDEHHSVTMTLKAKPTVADVVLLDFEAEYVSIIEFIGEVDEQEKKHIMEDGVPRTMYDHLRNLFWNLVSKSRFPSIMLNEFDFIIAGNKSESDEFDEFDDEREDDDIELDFVKSRDVEEYIDYNWILGRMVDIEKGKATLMKLKKYVSDIKDINQMPFYKYYMRFLPKVEYGHPDFPQCDQSVWDLLLKMIFVNPKIECRFQDGEDDLPDVFVSWDNFHNVSIKSLDYETFKELLEYAASYAFIELNVSIIVADVNESYGNLLRKGALPTNEEIRTLYYYYQLDELSEERAFVDNIFQTIREFDKQTFIYRL